MTTVYTTIDGDRLDLICWRYYGYTTPSAERVLEANPGLADRGVAYPAGVGIALPELPKPNRAKLVPLW